MIIKTFFNKDFSQIEVKPAEKILEIQHNHFDTPSKQNFPDPYYSKSEVNFALANERTKIKGCMGFFKTYAKNEAISLEMKAAATQAWKEDKARLEVFTYKK